MFWLFRARSARLSGSPRQIAPDRCASEAAVAAALPDQGQLTIPVAKLGADDLIGRKTIEHGRHLARQDRWAELSSKMRAADDAREIAPDGLPIADLLAFGARSDVVLAAEHALSDSKALAD